MAAPAAAGRLVAVEDHHVDGRATIRGSGADRRATGVGRIGGSVERQRLRCCRRQHYSCAWRVIDRKCIRIDLTQHRQSVGKRLDLILCRASLGNFAEVDCRGDGAVDHSQDRVSARISLDLSVPGEIADAARLAAVQVERDRLTIENLDLGLRRCGSSGRIQILQIDADRLLAQDTEFGRGDLVAELRIFRARRGSEEGAEPPAAWASR